MKTQVREISAKGSTSLIEWSEEGTVNRASVPSDLLVRENGVTYFENPQEGALYGEDWEALVPAVDPTRVASRLRQAGIWTYNDFLQNTPAVSSAFRAACGESYQEFIQAVHSRQSVQRKDE